MNLQEIKTFLAIVETGSLVRASAMLNITQSTVTARLKMLEDHLGQTLLYRNKSGAVLTAAGIKFLRYAETISQLWGQARQELSLPKGTSGLCNLACDYALWPGLGDRFFDILQAQAPDVAISVWLGGQAEVVEWLETGKSDIAITYHPQFAKSQDQIILPTDELILVATGKDTPARFDPGYVFVEAGDVFGRHHAAAYADADTARLSFYPAQLGLDYLLEKGGSAYLPRRMVDVHLERCNLYEVPDALTFERMIYLTYNREAQLSWAWFDDALNAMGWDAIAKNR
jgi:DNA-binding transcriptional LysR family regulator